MLVLQTRLGPINAIAVQIALAPPTLLGPLAVHARLDQLALLALLDVVALLTLLAPLPMLAPRAQLTALALQHMLTLLAMLVVLVLLFPSDQLVAVVPLAWLQFEMLTKMISEHLHCIATAAWIMGNHDVDAYVVLLNMTFCFCLYRVDSADNGNYR